VKSRRACREQDFLRLLLINSETGVDEKSGTGVMEEKDALMWRWNLVGAKLGFLHTFEKQVEETLVTCPWLCWPFAVLSDRELRRRGWVTAPWSQKSTFFFWEPQTKLKPPPLQIPVVDGHSSRLPVSHYKDPNYRFGLERTRARPVT
jgi:hypothetical protein